MSRRRCFASVVIVVAVVIVVQNIRQRLDLLHASGAQLLADGRRLAPEPREDARGDDASAASSSRCPTCPPMPPGPHAGLSAKPPAPPPSARRQRRGSRRAAAEDRARRERPAARAQRLRPPPRRPSPNIAPAAGDSKYRAATRRPADWAAASEAEAARSLGVGGRCGKRALNGGGAARGARAVGNEASPAFLRRSRRLGRRHGHGLGLDQDRGRRGRLPSGARASRARPAPVNARASLLDTPRVRPHALAHGGPGLAPARGGGRDLPRRPRRRLERLDDVPKYAFGVRGRRTRRGASAPSTSSGGSGRAPAARLFQASSSASFRALVFQKRARRCPSGRCPAGRAAASESFVGRVQPRLDGLPVLPLSFLLAQGGLAPLSVRAATPARLARSCEYQGILVGAASSNSKLSSSYVWGVGTACITGTCIWRRFYIPARACAPRPWPCGRPPRDDARRRRRAALRLRALLESWLASKARLCALSSCFPCQVVAPPLRPRPAVRRPVVPIGGLGGPSTPIVVPLFGQDGGAGSHNVVRTETPLRRCGGSPRGRARRGDCATWRRGGCVAADRINSRQNPSTILAAQK